MGKYQGLCTFFQKAYYFLNLMWVYAKAYDEGTAATDHGIVLRLNSDFNTPSVRSSVRDCYDKIILDAKRSGIALTRPALTLDASHQKRLHTVCWPKRIYQCGYMIALSNTQTCVCNYKTVSWILMAILA